MKNTALAGFEVQIRCHTADAVRILRDPERVRTTVADALERWVVKGKIYLQEEVDFTLEVSRVHQRHEIEEGA